MDSSVVSVSTSPEFLSMLTLPTYPVRPAFSNSSIKIMVDSRCREEKAHTRVVPLAIISRAKARYTSRA